MNSATPVLDSIFFQEVNPAVRMQALHALTNRSLVQRAWVSEDHRRGCLMAVATMEITGMRARRFAKLDDHVTASSKALGISTARVVEGYQEWDALPKDAAQRYIAGLRVRYAQMLAEQPPTQRQGYISRTVSAVRELVSV